MTHVRRVIPFLVLIILLSACQTAPLADTPTPAFVTATLPPTAAPPPTSTPTPENGAQTATGIAGTLTAKVNVRSEPSTSGEALGMLDTTEIIEVLGKDASGAWYQITYPSGPEGKGWVNAAYVQLDEDVEAPTIGKQDDDTPRATLSVPLNVRSQPDSGSNSLGILQAQAVVTLTGKSSSGDWLQIEYPAGSGEKGWIAAQYVQAEGVEALPVLSESGTPAGTATPAAPLPTPTFTLLPAPQDGDSAKSPVVAVAFMPGGARQFSFTGQVSAPEGDAEDWVAFTPYGQPGALVNMHLGLECSGRGDVASELWLKGQPMADINLPACGEKDVTLALLAGQVYQLRFQAREVPGSLQSVGYIITISNGP